MPMPPADPGPRKYTEVLVQMISEANSPNATVSIPDLCQRVVSLPMQSLSEPRIKQILRYVNDYFRKLGSNGFSVAFNTTGNRFVAQSFISLKASIPKEKTP